VTASAASPAASSASASRLPAATVSGWSGPRILLLSAASSRHQATAGPVSPASARLYPVVSSSRWHLPDHSTSPAACRKLTAHARRAAAGHDRG